MSRYFIPLAGFLLLVALLAVGLNLNPREVPSPFIGKPAPAFEAPQLEVDGNLSSTTFAGDVWLLNVWASWCNECRREHAVLDELIKQQQLKAVGLNYKDDTRDAKRWLAQFGNPFAAIATDPQGKVGLEWGVYGTPETFIIDRQGIIRYKHIGPLTTRVVQDKIVPLLAELRKEAGQ